MQDDLKPKLDTWTVETADIRGRVQAAIGCEPIPAAAELLEEIRSLRREMADLRRSIALLQHDTGRLRAGPSTPVRIAAYAPVESLIRLS